MATSRRKTAPMSLKKLAFRQPTKFPKICRAQSLCARATVGVGTNVQAAPSRQKELLRVDCVEVGVIRTSSQGFRFRNRKSNMLGKDTE